jgi:hypothetical protein
VHCYIAIAFVAVCFALYGTDTPYPNRMNRTGTIPGHTDTSTGTHMTTGNNKTGNYCCLTSPGSESKPGAHTHTDKQR